MSPAIQLVAFLGALAIPAMSSETSGRTLVSERPEWKVGDFWLYRRVDQRSGDTGNRRIVVDAIRPDGGYTLKYGSGRIQETDANFEYAPSDTAEYAPLEKEQWQRWPIRVGERRTWTVPVRMVAGNGVASTRLEVAAAEEVSVPAGRFDCFRIESQREIMTYDARLMGRPSYSASTDKTVWYCPAVRNVAKEIVTWRDGYGGYSRTEFQLVRFRLVD